MSEARRHHYVPACYLSQFGMPRGDRTARIAVFDRKTGVSRLGSAGNEANVRDFYRIDHPYDPLLVEKVQLLFEKRLGELEMSVDKLDLALEKLLALFS